MLATSPAFQQILAQTRVKVGDLPLQGLASPILGVGIGLTVVTLLLATPVFFVPSWKAALAPWVLGIYAGSLICMSVALGLLALGLLINFLRASHVRAGRFDRQHAAEQELAEALAKIYPREVLQPTIGRLQLEIDMIESTKAAITAVGAFLGSLTPLTALVVPLSGSPLKSDDVVKLAVAAAGAGGAIALLLTLRFKDHLTRARHVLQQSQQRRDAASPSAPLARVEG